MIFRFLLAAFVGFFFLFGSAIFLDEVALDCDAYSRAAAVAFWIFPSIALVAAFVAVFFAALCLPPPFRKKGSRDLLLLGLACYLPFCLTAPTFFLDFLFLALGGLGSVLIFKKLDLEPSKTVRRQRVAFISTGIFCLLILFAKLLYFGGRSVPLTKEKAATLFDKAGGLEKVNQEAASVFERVGTNEMHFFDDTDEREYPALSQLGRSIAYYGRQEDSGPVIMIGFGTHDHYKSISIFPLNHGTIHAFEMNSSKYIQMTNNIFITK